MMLFEPTLDDMIACVKREIGQRRRVYARLVTQGKMTEQKSEYEIACMQAVLANLEKQKPS